MDLVWFCYEQGKKIPHFTCNGINPDARKDQTSAIHIIRKSVSQRKKKRQFFSGWAPEIDFKILKNCLLDQKRAQTNERTCVLICGREIGKLHEKTATTTRKICARVKDIERICPEKIQQPKPDQKKKHYSSKNSTPQLYKSTRNKRLAAHMGNTA